MDDSGHLFDISYSQYILLNPEKRSVWPKLIYLSSLPCKPVACLCLSLFFIYHRVCFPFLPTVPVSGFPSASLPGDRFPISLDSCPAHILATWLFNLMTAVLLHNKPTYNHHSFICLFFIFLRSSWVYYLLCVFPFILVVYCVRVLFLLEANIGAGKLTSYQLNAHTDSGPR